MREATKNQVPVAEQQAPDPELRFRMGYIHDGDVQENEIRIHLSTLRRRSQSRQRKDTEYPEQGR